MDQYLNGSMGVKFHLQKKLGIYFLGSNHPLIRSPFICYLPRLDIQVEDDFSGFQLGDFLTSMC